MTGLLPLILGVAWAGPPAVGAATERGALVLVRSLSYDRAVARETGELRMGVVYAGPSGVGEGVLKVVADLQGVTVSGRAIGSPVGIVAAAGVDWTAKLAGLDAVVLCPGVADLVALVDAARTLDVVVLTLDPAWVGRGAALGVDLDGTRLQLLVDRGEAVAQGAEFAAELLEMAVPVRP